MMSIPNKDLLLWSRVEAGQINQDIFEANYTMIQDNPGFGDMLKKMSTDPAMSFMYQTMLAAGPSAFLQVVGMMVNSGVVDKKQVREATGIKRAPKTQKAWHKQIAEDLFPKAHQYLSSQYAQAVDEYRTKFPSETIPDTLEGFLRATGKASISTTVDSYDHPQSKKSCALALVLRVDVNCAARNGTKEEKAPTNGVSE